MALLAPVVLAARVVAPSQVPAVMVEMGVSADLAEPVERREAAELVVPAMASISPTPPVQLARLPQ